MPTLGKKIKKKKVKVYARENCADNIMPSKGFLKKLCVYKAKNTHTFFKKILHRIFPPVELNTFFFFLFFLLEIFLRSRVDEHSRIIKSRVMQNFKVRTYDVQQATPKTAIFILNRGRNAENRSKNLVRTALFYTAAT